MKAFAVRTIATLRHSMVKSSRFAWLTRLIFGLIMMAYPILVFWGLHHGSIRKVALILCLMVALRFFISNRAASPAASSWIFLSTLPLLLFSLFLGEGQFLLWQPVLINVGLGFMFGGSLRSSQSLIERIARLRTPQLPPEGVHYCRTVTKVWIAFFAINASMAIITILFCSIQIWTLYNGLIAYILIGALFTGEYLIRRKALSSKPPLTS
ncbi:MAG TPA: hypothetical protein VLM37_12770 [Fibrobacteraceae bacterium]|nr:hypothetical protein [Fibrobacteraceae bacterium]